MSNEIHDDGALKFDVGLMPMTMLDMFRQCAQTSQFSDGGTRNRGVDPRLPPWMPPALLDGAEVSKSMSSALLYPFYGGKKVPDEVIHTPDYWGLSTVTIHRDAAQIGWGQSVVVIVNTLSSGIKVTRPYRDGGWMLGIPRDANGTDNHIPGKTTMDGADYFGVGAYANDSASIFYGSGAVLSLVSDDGKLPAAAVAYGSSINGGSGLGVTAHASSVASDAKGWFSKTGDKTDFKPGTHVADTNGHLKITASVASWEDLKSNKGGLFTVLLEQV